MAMQRAHSSLWAKSIVVEHGSVDYNGTSYKIRIMKVAGHIITRTQQHMKHTPI